MINAKTVLITGAGSGIGRALAVEAASKGFSLILAGRTKTTIEQTKSKCSGSNVRFVVADVTTAD